MVNGYRNLTDEGRERVDYTLDAELNLTSLRKSEKKEIQVS